MSSEELVAKIKKISIMVPGDEKKRVIIHEKYGEIIVFSITINELGWLGLYKAGKMFLSNAMSPVKTVELVEVNRERISLNINSKSEKVDFII